MSTTAEIWIDHQRAVITTVSAHGSTLSEVRIQAVGRLPQFHSDVIAAIGDAMTVLVFGPGDTKTELGRRLSLSPARTRIHGMGTPGVLTERQILDRSRDLLFT